MILSVGSRAGWDNRVMCIVGRVVWFFILVWIVEWIWEMGFGFLIFKVIIILIMYIINRDIDNVL